MSFRTVMIVSLALMMSLPVFSAEKRTQRKANRELASVYESLIRDSQKQLAPSLGQRENELPTSLSPALRRAPASEKSFQPVHFDARYSASPARHAAIPWAAEATVGGAAFSLK